MSEQPAQPTPEKTEERFRQLLREEDLEQPDEVEFDPAANELIFFGMSRRWPSWWNSTETARSTCGPACTRPCREICWHIMKRTTVKIPDELDAKLRHEAKRCGLTISDVTREALEAHLGQGRPLLRAAAASGRSGYGNLSRRIEEIIAQEADQFRS